MSGAAHLLLPFKRTNRYAGRFTFLMMAALAGGFYWIFNYDIERETFFPLFGGILLAMLAAEAVPLLRPRLRASDGLRLGAEGLALSRAGRTVQWGWTEISDLRMRSRLHPAGLFLGRFLTFRVPADGRRKNAGFATDGLFLGSDTVAIGDDYTSDLKDLRDQIEEFRAAAGSGVRRQAGGTPPEPMWSFRKDRKQLKLWHVAALALGPVIGVGLGSLIMEGLPEDLDLLDSLESFGRIAMGALIAAPYLLITSLQKQTAQNNMVVLSAGGLSVWHGQERRDWRWTEIIDLEVKESISRGKDGAAARVISFRAAHDGSEVGRSQHEKEPSTPVFCSVEDEYETPVEDIARQAQLWLNWAGRTFERPAGSAAVDASAEVGSRDAAGATPAAVYSRSPGVIDIERSALEGLLPLLILTPMTLITGLTVWSVKTDGGSWLLWLPWWAMIIGFLVVVFVPLIIALGLVDPSLNRLELSEEALEMTRMGRTSRWSWAEVGPAELRRVRTKWSAKRRAVLTIAVPAATWGSRYLRWAHNLEHTEPIAVIEDSYDTPLDAVAEAINLGRRKHGGRTAKG